MTSQKIRAVGASAATPYFSARRYFTAQSQPLLARCQLAYKLNNTFGFTRRPAHLGPCSFSSFCLASHLRCWVCCGYGGRWEITGIAATEKGHLASSKKKPSLIIYGHILFVYWYDAVPASPYNGLRLQGTTRYVSNNCIEHHCPLFFWYLHARMVDGCNGPPFVVTRSLRMHRQLLLP